MMTTTSRPLSPEEICRRREMSFATPQRMRAGIRRTITSSVVILGTFLAITLLVTDVRWEIITVLWMTLGIIVTVWSIWALKRDYQRFDQYEERILASGKAWVVHIQSAQVAELEEIEDEGACYAFQVDPERLIVVAGPEFYSTESFPNCDFEIIYAIDGNGVRHFLSINTHGAALMPVRIISRRDRKGLRMPDHLEVIHGTIATIDSALALPG